MSLSYPQFKASADFILSKIGFEPDVCLILGSALGTFSDSIEGKVTVDYADIPFFPTTTVPGHAGKLICGTLGGKKLVCMSGRFHYYEGHSFETLSLPVRIFSLLKAKATVLTNASGGINEDYAPGDIVLIRDHIKFFSDSPMRGANISEFGPRFFDMTETYTPALLEKARQASLNTGIEVKEGVYCFFPGPQFETPAEIRAARTLGGDLAGMSTVPEAITAAQCSMPLLAMSLVTNMAAGVVGKKLTHSEVNEVGDRFSEKFRKYMTEVIRLI